MIKIQGVSTVRSIDDTIVVGTHIVETQNGEEIHRVIRKINGRIAVYTGPTFQDIRHNRINPGYVFEALSPELYNHYLKLL